MRALPAPSNNGRKTRKSDEKALDYYIDHFYGRRHYRFILLETASSSPTTHDNILRNLATEVCDRISFILSRDITTFDEIIRHISYKRMSVGWRMQIIQEKVVSFKSVLKSL